MAETAHPETSQPGRGGRPFQRRWRRWRRWVPFLVWGLPALAVFASGLLPVATGSETFVLRDVLDVHVMLVAPQVDALEDGVLPVVDMSRSSGQPASGNPNAVPFYPTRLLFLVLPFFAAFGLHFVLHLVLAVPAMAWLGRAWGLSRPAAWAAGVAYGLSGFALSHANFFNLVASLALIPAFAAACLGLAAPDHPHRRRARRGRRGRTALRLAGAAVLWGLLLVSGDPMMAGLGLVLGLAAVVVREARWPGRSRASGEPDAPETPARRKPLQVAGAFVGALSIGVLLALPQLVELGRIVGSSFRGIWRFGAVDQATFGAWHPLALSEWLIPTIYGRIDLTGPGRVWAFDWFAGDPPLYLSLAPGLVALAWVLVSGLPRDRRAVWAWGSIAVGVFFALGVRNPLVVPILELPGLGAFRYPAKMWPLVAVPLGVLAGVGFERTFGTTRDEARVRLRPCALALAGLGLAVVVFMGVMIAVPGAAEALVASGAPERYQVETIAAVERGRWLAQAVVTVATVLAGLGLLALARRRVRTASALLLVLHAASQLFLLRPLLITADTAQLAEPPAVFQVLQEVAGDRDPSTLRVVHGDYLGLFGTPPVSRGFALERSPEVSPRAYHEMVPWAGVLHGLRYEGNRSPEGLDSFLAQMGRTFMSQTDDRSRVAALETWGATHLLMTHPLDGVSDDSARLAATLPPVPGLRSRPLFLYELPRATPEVFFAELAVPTPHINATWHLMVHPDFDPDRLALTPSRRGTMEPVDDPDRVPGLVAESRRNGDGTARLLSVGDEALTVQVESPRGGVLVTRRNHLPVWKASIDGEEVATEVVNISRLGVRVPAGEHRVRLWVDRQPLVLAIAGSGVGLLALLVMVGWGAFGWPGRRPKV